GSKQPFILEESLIDTMADQRTMAELLRAPTKGYVDVIMVPPILAEQFELKHSLINMMTTDQFFGLEKDNPHDHIRWGSPPVARKITLAFYSHAWDRYKDLLHACPHHGFTELHQLDTFYNALNPADQDSLNAAAGGNLLERRTQDVLTIIENKSKVRNSRNKSIVSQVKSCDANSNSFSEIAKLTHAVNQQTSVVTTAMTDILKQFQETPPPTSVKAIEETCVTCGGAHPYYQCLVAGGNTFPELRDNIQGYVSAAAVNYNQGNSVYRPPGSGSLPSNTVANPKGELKAITTRSGLVLDGPTVPTHPTIINPEVDERVDETLTNPNLSEYTIKVPPPPVQKYKPPSQREYVLHINITLADALILMPKYQKMLKALLSNKEKLQELANTPLNENCSAIILKKLLEKLKDPGKFLILCGFSELKCKALSDLGASINLMPLSVWKKLGLPELISTCMTLEQAKRAICTPAGIARDVFVPVGKFTFPADFVIVDYESDPRVPLILGRPFLRTARALIDIHGEEMILRDEGGNVLPKKLLDLDSTKDLHPPLHDIDSSLKDSIDQSNLANLADNFVDSMPKMFADEHALDYSSLLIFDEYDDDFLEVESDTKNVYDDPFDSKGEKIKESKLLIDELDIPCDFLLTSKYDSFISQHFSRVNAKTSPNNEDKVFNPCILSQEKTFEIITRVVQDKKLATSNASLVLEDFDPPFYEPLFFKEVPRSKMLFPFSSKNEEKVFKPGIHTSKKVHSSHIIELSHQGYKVFKINQIFKSPMKNFLFSCEKDTHILPVPCLHFYALDQFKYGGIRSS
nr:DNA-directed DNA polymerase [Tanacetum cinerariifolium]